MKTAFTLEKVLNDVKQFDLPRRVLPKSFHNPMKGAVGPASLQEVELPSMEPKTPLEVRQQILSDEIDRLIQLHHPLRRFWRVQIKTWLVKVFWIE
jgi:hypothetical protein